MKRRDGWVVSRDGSVRQVDVSRFTHTGKDTYLVYRRSWTSHYCVARLDELGLGRRGPMFVTPSEDAAIAWAVLSATSGGA